MMQAKASNNLPADDNSLLYVILCVFGLSIVVYAIVQNDLNAIAEQA